MLSSYDHNSDTFIACFTDNAVVKDEGKDIQGTKAIKEYHGTWICRC